MVTMENKDIEILNNALSLEQFVIAAYGIGAKTGILSDKVMSIAKIFQNQHGQHASKITEVIISLGGYPVRSLSHEEYVSKIPKNINTEEKIIQYALNLEKKAAITFLNAIPEFSNPKLAQAAASIMGDETMHWAILREALGLIPVHISFIPLNEDEVQD